MTHLQEEWRESALGGGLVFVFMMTVGAPVFATMVLKGMSWALLVAGLTIALLVFVDRNGSGLRGQVLRPGRAAVIGSAVLAFGVRMILN